MKTGRRLPVRLRQRLRLLAAALLLRSAGVGAAAFVPGPPEADQPTGATGREEPVQALPAGCRCGRGCKVQRSQQGHQAGRCS